MDLVAPPPELSSAEVAIWRVLQQSSGRVVNRTELMRRAGLSRVTARRIDVLLVAVRRAVGSENLLNVRGRGWMLIEPDPATATGADPVTA